MIEIADNLTRTAEAAFDDGGWAQSILLDGILSKGRRLFCRLPLRLRKRRPLANDLPAQHVVIHVSSHSSLSAEAK